MQILAKSSFCELWSGDINGKEYSHSRVYKISGDRFYALVTGVDDAFLQIYKNLPSVIDEYLNSIEKKDEVAENSAIDEIKNETVSTKRSILEQITFENYSYYLGFDKL
ncbi:Eco47II restriction endonuclease [compost metagenome]